MVDDPALASGGGALGRYGVNTPLRERDANARPLALAERLWARPSARNNKTHTVLRQSSVAPTTDEASKSRLDAPERGGGLSESDGSNTRLRSALRVQPNERMISR